MQTKGPDVNQSSKVLCEQKAKLALQTSRYMLCSYQVAIIAIRLERPMPQGISNAICALSKETQRDVHYAITCQAKLI
eukprot:4672091-Amphidinium_carterae.1